MATIKDINGGPGKANPLDNVDLTHAKTLECEKCQCVGFKQTMMLKKLSALVSPTGQEAIVPVGVFACDHCGHVNKEFREAEIQKA